MNRNYVGETIALVLLILLFIGGPIYAIAQAQPEIEFYRHACEPFENIPNTYICQIGGYYCLSLHGRPAASHSKIAWCH